MKWGPLPGFRVINLTDYMKKQITKMAALSAMLVMSTAAFADPTLIISDGVTSTGPITLTGGAGTYSTTTFDSSWSVIVTTGSSKPVSGSAQNPNMNLTIFATSLGSANNLQIILSDTNFGPTLGQVEASLNGHPFAGNGDVISYDTYYDAGDGVAALTTPISADNSIVPNGSNIYLSDRTNILNLAAPYSLSQVVTIKGSQIAQYSLSATLQATNQAPPPCVCTLKFTSPSLTTNCAGEAIADITATQDCGSGPIPVTGITQVSAVTNGSCPQVIVRTVSATDGCGNAHTFVQTNIVNCLPDCTITTSVKTTIVGTSNLTASVADAGAGATYTWNVLNGTITGGQGTTKITFTAGTDTNSPVSIMVKIVAGTGCENDCAASVKLTPMPPKISLGHGDTATIGFWHNKNGQGLILNAPSTAPLGDWLASNFPCMFGNLAGKNNATVAALFMTDFGVKGEKTYAQVLAGAFACYFTSSNLGGGSASAQFGFNVTPGGTGSKTFNVGSLGTVIGLQNNTSYTVLQILQAANANANCSNGTFSSAVFDALNTIFDGINQGGDIS